METQFYKIQKVTFRNFRIKDQLQVTELVSISLRDTGSKHSASIKNKLEKYINKSIEGDLRHIDQYYNEGIFLVAVFEDKIIGSLGGRFQKNPQNLRSKKMRLKKRIQTTRNC